MFFMDEIVASLNAGCGHSLGTAYLTVAAFARRALAVLTVERASKASLTFLGRTTDPLKFATSAV